MAADCTRKHLIRQPQRSQRTVRNNQHTALSMPTYALPPFLPACPQAVADLQKRREGAPTSGKVGGCGRSGSLGTLQSCNVPLSQIPDRTCPHHCFGRCRCRLLSPTSRDTQVCVCVCICVWRTFGLHRSLQQTALCVGVCACVWRTVGFHRGSQQTAQYTSVLTVHIPELLSNMRDSIERQVAAMLSTYRPLAAHPHTPSAAVAVC